MKFKVRKVLVGSIVMGSLVLSLATVASGEKIHITWWGHTHKPHVEAYEELISMFEKENPNISVTNVPKPGGQYEQLLKTAMATGNTPDVFRVGSWNIASYIKDGLVAPLVVSTFDVENVQEIQERFMPGVISNIMMDEEGNLYAVPEDHSTLMLILNMDMFKKIGITKESLPTNYLDWIEVLKKLVVKEGGVTKHTGFEWWYNHQLWNTQETNVVMRSYGTYLFDETGLNSGLETPAAAAALEYIYNTANVWKICNPHYAIASGLGTGLETGYTATHTAGFWIKGLIDSGGVIEDWWPIQWRTGPIDTVFNWAWCYGLSPDSKHKEAASKWIAFQVREDIARWEGNKYGHMKGHASMEKWQAARESPQLLEFLRLKPKGRYQDPTVNFLAQSKVIMTLRQNLIQKGMSVEEARKIAVEELKEIRERILSK